MARLRWGFRSSLLCVVLVAAPGLAQPPPGGKADGFTTACELQAARAPGGAQTVARCSEAAMQPGASARVWLLLARAQLAARDTLGAAYSLAQARPRLDDQTPPAQWATFVELAVGARHHSWAEEAAVRLGAAEREVVEKEVARERRWLGLPRGAAVPADQEARYLKAVVEVQRRLSLDELDKAVAALQPLEQEFPRVPGTLAARCAVEVARGAQGRPGPACDEALAAQPDNLYVRLQRGTYLPPPQAIQELETLLVGDPSHELSYRRLRDLHKRAGNQAALAALRRAYGAQFSRRFPVDETVEPPGPTSVSAGLDEEQVQRVVRRHQNQVNSCVEAARARSPGLAGKLVLTWDIDKEGAVSAATVVRSSSRNGTLEECVKGRVRTWRFPVPDGTPSVAVTYQWQFEPG